MPDPAVSQAAAYRQLRGHAESITRDPLTNSVLRQAQDYFFALSDGRMDIGVMDSLVGEIGADLFAARAKRLAQQHEADGPDHWEASRAAWTDLADNSFEVFKAKVEAPSSGVVFTAHPTFAHSQLVRTGLAECSSGGSKSRRFDAVQHEDVTLKGEHEEAQACILNAQNAVRTYLETLLDFSMDRFPDKWLELNPAAPTLASWVGYDLDGRDDIRWWTTLSYRLTEKADQLQRYADRVRQLAVSLSDISISATLEDFAERLQRAEQLSRRQAEGFRADFSDPDRLVIAANLLTEANDDRLIDLSEDIRSLRNMAAQAHYGLARDLKVLAKEMELFGLGTARIHLRINAAQIQTVIRRDLGVLTEDRQLGRVALETLAQRTEDCRTVDVNFADLFLEQSTARRQFMLCAQILKHIDASTPIRFLIAESENPATVLGALYLARQYSVDDTLDISPLFETPEALENGGRFIARLLEVPVFSDYVRERGQLSVQLGFSDAGRFIGQIAANMAIERIHNLIAQALADALPGTRLLFFNTHGESMGRGGYPGDFTDRLDHLLTPWTRRRCLQRGIPLVEESSFQGGDGYLHFATTALALSAYDHIAAHTLRTPPEQEDPFYVETSLVWDFYRALRTWQEALFDDPDYGVLVSGFASGFRVKAGSRPQRRAGGPTGPRSLRAISHNATLQQLAALANTACGIGSSLRRETDDLVDLINTSPRLRKLIDLAVKARLMTSIPALRAYATAYSPSFWVASSKHLGGARREARVRLSTSLKSRQTFDAMMATANDLSIDLGRFDQLIARLEDSPSVGERHELRLPLHLLHAIRIGAMMRALEIAGSLPAISARHGFDVEDIKDLILDMKLGEAADLISQLYPLGAEQFSTLDELTEPRAGGTGSNETDYARLQDEWVTPLNAIDTLIRKTSLAIAHAHDAYG